MKPLMHRDTMEPYDLGTSFTSMGLITMNRSR